MREAGHAVDRHDLQQLLNNDIQRLIDAAIDISLTKEGSQRAVLLIIDQAEELVSISDHDERARFLEALGAALAGRSPLRLLSTLRTEVLGAAIHDAAFADLIEETVLLGPLDRSRLPEVIEGPGQTAGLRFAPGLVARMVDDTQGGDALPLLAYTLRRLTEDGKTDAGLISHESYDSIGGVLGALETGANVAKRDIEQAGHSAAVIPTLLKLVTLDANGEPARRPLRRDELTDVELGVVDAFVDARLLTSDGQIVQVAHEALLRSWEPLRQAIEGSRQRLRIQSNLRQQAREWNDAGRSDGYLLHDERLQAVQVAMASAAPVERLSGLEGEYYEASVALETRQRAVQRQKRRRSFIALSVAVVVLATATIVATWQYRVAKSQTDLADSRGLAAQAITVSDQKLELAMLLAVEAWRSADTIEARSAALATLQRSEGIQAVLRNSNESQVVAAAFSPTEPLLAVDGGDQTIRLWDLTTHSRRGDPLSMPGSDQNDSSYDIAGLAFSSNGKTLAALYDSGDIVLWKTGGDTAPRMVMLPNQNIGQVVRFAFSPDGATLAATAFDGYIALWDVARGEPIDVPRRAVETSEQMAVSFADKDTFVTFNEGVSGRYHDTGGQIATWAVRQNRPTRRLPLLPGEHIYTSALARGGGTLVTLSGNSQLIAWDTRTGRRLARYTRDEISVTEELRFDPSGTRLAAVTDDRHVELFDVPSLAMSAVQPPKIEAAGVEFSSDGRSLAIAGRGATTVWSLASPMPLSTPLFTARTAYPEDLAASVGMSKSDPNQLVSVAKKRLRIWRLPDPTPAEVPVPEYIQAVAMSPDGSVTAILDYDGELAVWHPGDRQVSPGWRMNAATSHIEGGRYKLEGITSLALSADAGMLASAGSSEDDKSQIRLWDPRRGVQWGQAVQHGDAVVWTLAFTPKADMLASAGYPGSISVWKVVANGDGTKHLEPFGQDRPLVGHSGAVMSIEFDRSGKRLVSGGGDGTVRLWDIATGTAIGEPMSMGSSVESVAFSPDGRTVAAADREGLRLWDVATQRMLGPTIVTRGRLAAVSFSADGRRLATINDYGSVLVWDPLLWSDDRNAVSERLCLIASRNLTRSEWHQYLPEKEYRQTCTRWPGAP
jgi:WD40 repeat protein